LDLCLAHHTLLLPLDNNEFAIRAIRAGPNEFGGVFNSDFIEHHYLPHVAKTLRASTLKGYKNDIYRKHIKERLGELRLCDFRTVHAQRILREIPEIGHTTRLRVKSFLSGVFKHALQEGFLDGHNPVREASAPGSPNKFKGPTYTLRGDSENIRSCGKERYEGVCRHFCCCLCGTTLGGIAWAALERLRWDKVDRKPHTLENAHSWGEN
jgi:hypothetical protein